MPMDLVEAAFEKPFAPVSQGGCPDVSSANVRPRAPDPTSSWHRQRAATLRGLYGPPRGASSDSSARGGAAAGASERDGATRRGGEPAPRAKGAAVTVAAPMVAVAR